MPIGTAQIRNQRIDCSTRKRGKMAESVALAEFTYWERYSPGQVVAAG